MRKYCKSKQINDNKNRNTEILLEHQILMLNKVQVKMA